jgi:hypothetical protein
MERGIKILINILNDLKEITFINKHSKLITNSHELGIILINVKSYVTELRDLVNRLNTASMVAINLAINILRALNELVGEIMDNLSKKCSVYQYNANNLYNNNKNIIDANAETLKNVCFIIEDFKPVLNKMVSNFNHENGSLPDLLNEPDLCNKSSESEDKILIDVLLSELENIKGHLGQIKIKFGKLYEVFF